METISKLTEYSSLRFSVDRPLTLPHARWLRGAIAQQFDRPEFHHHIGKHLIYQHPLIRYATCANDASILGLAEGAFLLRSLPTLRTLRLGADCLRIKQQETDQSRVRIGSTREAIVYRFQSPFLALNQANHDRWQRSDTFSRRRLLERVVIGNLLSLSKAIHLHIEEQLCVEVHLEPDDWHELKPGVRLLGFLGEVKLNFELPSGWGIGKSSARGFGTLIREKDQNGRQQN